MNNKHNLGKTLTAIAAVMLAGLAAPMATATHDGDCPDENMVLVPDSGTPPTYATSGESFAEDSEIGAEKAERINNLGTGTWRFTALLDNPEEDVGAILSVRVLAVDSAGVCTDAEPLLGNGVFQADGDKDFYFEVVLSAIPPEEAENPGPYEFTATLERISPV